MRLLLGSRGCEHTRRQVRRGPGLCAVREATFPTQGAGKIYLAQPQGRELPTPGLGQPGSSQARG